MIKKYTSYRDLQIWQKSMDFVEKIYNLTNQFPKSETYSLVSQLRRASVSVPSNIAEGSRRGSQKEFRNFLRISYASGAEIETQLEIAKRLKYISDEELINTNNLITELQKMLNSFIKNMKV